MKRASQDGRTDQPETPGRPDVVRVCEFSNKRISTNPMLNTSTPSPKSDWFLRVSFVSRQIHFRASRREKAPSKRQPQSVSATLLPIKISLRTPISSPRPSRFNNTTYRNVRGGSRRCSSTAINAVGHVRGLLNPRQEKNCKIGATDTAAALRCPVPCSAKPLSDPWCPADGARWAQGLAWTLPIGPRVAKKACLACEKRCMLSAIRGAWPESCPDLAATAVAKGDTPWERRVPLARC